MSKTEMKLFDKQFVHFIWDDTLLHKLCFYADTISQLIKYVEENRIAYKGTVMKSANDDYPFTTSSHDTSNMRYRFVYYDPNYELKCVFYSGKTIQYMDSNGYWHDCLPNWNAKEKYRVKPIKYFVGIDKQKKLTFSYDPATYKHVYASFDVAADASKWIDEHRKFVPVMRAFEKGLTIEYKCKGKGSIWYKASAPTWRLQFRYRVKPMQSVCYAGIKEVHNCNDRDGFIQRKRRRMTNRELAKWLADGNGQLKLLASVRISYDYVGEDNCQVPADCKIRGWNETEWHEPEVK